MIIDGKNSVNLKHLRDFQNFWLSKFLKNPLRSSNMTEVFPSITFTKTYISLFRNKRFELDEKTNKLLQNVP